MKPIHRLSIFSIVISMSLPAAAQSTWNGTTNANWSTATNWSPGIPAEPAPPSVAPANIIIADTTSNGLTLNDASHSVGSITIGATGTRTSAFTLNTTTANTLTINGGVTANGAFNSTTAIGPRLRGKFVIAANQNWQVGGEAGSAAADRGLAINEVASSSTQGSLTLNGTLTKTGVGQLTLGATNVSGASDIVISDGSLKLNAGGSLALTVGGTGKIIANNSATLLFSQNSGSFNVTRPIQFNLTSKVETGSGSNNKSGTFDIASNMEWNGVHTITNSKDNNNSANGFVNFRFTGVMSGAGTVTKTGASQLILAGASSNTLSGQVTVSGGDLRLEKTGGATAVPGNILVTGGTLTVALANQIADTSSITVTGGALAFTADRAETIASLSIGSGAISSVSGFNVTGTTALSSGVHQLNSGQTFTTQSLSVSNGATLQFVGNATAPASSNVNVGTGGITFNSGKVQFGDPASGGGTSSTSQLNLSGDITSTGTSLFTAVNEAGPRIVDLQGASRSVTVNSGTLEFAKTTVQNGTIVKSGSGTLILSQSNSTADFSLTEGPVKINSLVTAANVALAGSSVQLDIAGTPSKITTSGNFTTTGGSIDISATNGTYAAGIFELVRYNGNLVGTPAINIPSQIQASRLNPILDYGTGTNSAITLTLAASPVSLVWYGANNGGAWNNNNTANFNSGSEKFYPLDSVTFDDTGASFLIQLDSQVFPTDVVFDHGASLATYLLSGSGGITGTTKLTKNGIGSTVLGTDNSYTGATEILGGVLQVGNGGLSGSLGTGPVLVDAGATLTFARDGSLAVPCVITGTGAIVHNGPGTVALTSDSTGFTGTVDIVGGTLQFGDGGAAGSLPSLINIESGATFAVKRGGTPTITNTLMGAGSVAISGGSPIFTAFNSYEGGISITDGGVLRAADDYVFGTTPFSLVSNNISLTSGGLKNQDSSPVINANRGVTISGEAYFTAGWSKSLTIAGPITGSGNIFINHDSGKVIFSDLTSNWNGILTIGANKPGYNNNPITDAIFETSVVTDGGVTGPFGAASADPANLVFDGGRLSYTGTDVSTNRGFTLLGAGTIDVVNANTLTMSGPITGPGSLVKAGVGKLELGGNSNFLGTKTINSGTVVLKSTSAFGDVTAFTRFSGTTGILDLATDTSVAPYPVTIGAGNSGTILSNVATPGPGINHTLGNFELSTITLNVAAGANVSGGDPRVTITNLNASAGASGTTTLNPTTANITVGSAFIGSGNFAKTISLGGTSQDNLVNGTISDGLNILTLRKDNTSMWTVSGNNTFTGNVAVDKGVMLITHTNALGGTNKTLYVNGNTNKPELRLSGGISPTVSVINLSGAGVGDATGAVRNISGNNALTATTEINMTTGNGGTTLYSDSGTLTINTPLFKANATGRVLTLSGPGNGVINGVIANGSTGALPVTKNGSGTWALNGAHTYSGATTINAGTLSLGQASLNDAAAVIISAGATLNLNFTGNDRVGSLTINGVAKPDGLYNATTDPGFITGTGNIRVGSEPSGYATWASAYPFTVGVNDGATNDPDGDGINNLLEYILGGVPVGAGASNSSILPVQTLNATSLVLTFRRSDSSETDATLKVQWSDDMTTWHDFTTIGPVSALPQVSVTEDSPSADLDTVTVTIPRSVAPGGKLFARVQAVK